MAGNRIPGSLGILRYFDQIDEGTLAQIYMPNPTPIGSIIPAAKTFKLSIDENTRILAATVYGESSGKDVFEEMAAIANVLVRQQKARGFQSIGVFIKSDKTFAFAAHDGNLRFAKLIIASDEEIVKDRGMEAAVKAARNALSNNPIDYSNEAFFWDGADIKSNYEKHPKVRSGIHFADPSHNIYGVESKNVPGEEWWKDFKGNKTKLRGKWNYKFESTAAYGGTIFWKYSADFLNATGNKEYN